MDDKLALADVARDRASFGPATSYRGPAEQGWPARVAADDQRRRARVGARQRRRRRTRASRARRSPRPWIRRSSTRRLLRLWRTRTRQPSITGCSAALPSPPRSSAFSSSSVVSATGAASSLARVARRDVRSSPCPRAGGLAGVLLLAHELLGLPLAYYRGVTLERRYGLSSETRTHWWLTHIKSLMVGGVLTVVARHPAVGAAGAQSGAMVALRGGPLRGGARRYCVGGAGLVAADLLRLPPARSARAHRAAARTGRVAPARR